MREAVDSLQLATGEFAVVHFSHDEISAAIAALKTGKSSGMSGISAELIHAMWSLDAGKTVLATFLNAQLEAGDQPRELHDSFVALVPKLQHVLHPQRIRPINLVEVCMKLFCRLLTQRLRSEWPQPPGQFGALQGGQVMDALCAAHWRTLVESLTTERSIWVNADIASAFDSLHHSEIADFIQRYTPARLSREALQLLRIVCHPRLGFPGGD